MGDFSNPHRQAPITGQMLPRTVYDLGALIELTGQGAGNINSSDSGQRGEREVNTSSRGVRVDMVIANKSGTIDVVLKVRRYDKASAAFVEMLASASQTANGRTTLTVHPDLTAAANSIAKDFIGEEWDVRVECGAGVTPSADITVGACLLP